MSKFLKVIGTILLLSIVPLTLGWIWFPHLWLQFILTDIVVFVAGIICVASSISKTSVVTMPRDDTPPPENPSSKSPLRWEN